MKRLAAVLLCALGIVLVLLGLLFLMGAGGRPYRYLIAVGCLATGGSLTGLGVRFFKQADAVSPEQLRADILALAQRRSGEISAGDVMAALGRRAAGAQAVLEALVAEGLCQRRSVKGAAYYVFQGLQPRLLVRRCEYCNAELPLAEETATCPSCGGTVKTQRESRSLSAGDDYKMDE